MHSASSSSSRSSSSTGSRNSNSNDLRVLEYGHSYIVFFFFFFHTKRAYVESKLLLASPPKVSHPAVVYRGYGEAVRALLASSSPSPPWSNRAVERADSSFSSRAAEEPEHFSVRSAEVSIANAREIRHCDHSPLIDRNEGRNGAHYLSLLIHRSADQVRCRIASFSSLLCALLSM